MKPFYLLLIASITCGMAYAQGDAEYKEPSKASYAQHDYRSWEAEPPYSLAKIKALVKKVKSVETADPDVFAEKLDPVVYQSLTYREKFTYHSIHAESYSQNCDVSMTGQDEDKKIFGRLLDIFGEGSWSDRQNKFFISNRDSVMYLIKDCVTRDKRVGLNYKHALVDINATEMIPSLINTYKNNKKDRDILSVLMLLMKNNEYQPFMASASNKKLFGSDEYSGYDAFLNFNTANEDLIIKRATDFYNGLQPKQ